MLYRVFDGHCDTPVELWLQEKQLRSSDLAVSLDKAAGLGGYAQFFAFCTAWIKTRMPHTEHFSRALDYFLAQLRKNEDRITLCRTAPEAEAAMQEGKCAAFLAIEGAEAVREDEGLLELAYEAGVRMVSLVWNLPNGLSGSCQTGEGLSEKGKDFFRRAQRLGAIHTFPRQIDVRSAEMAERGRLTINRATQIQHVDDAGRTKIKLLSDDFRQCVVGNDAGALRIDQQRNRIGHPDCVS